MPLAGSAVAPLLSPWALQQKGQRLGVSRTKMGSPKGFLCPNRGAGNPAPIGEGNIRRPQAAARPRRRDRQHGQRDGDPPRPKGSGRTRRRAHRRRHPEPSKPSEARAQQWRRVGDAVRPAAGAVQSRPKKGSRAPVGHCGSLSHPTPEGFPEEIGEKSIRRRDVAA